MYSTLKKPFAGLVLVLLPAFSLQATPTSDESGSKNSDDKVRIIDRFPGESTSEDSKTKRMILAGTQLLTSRKLQTKLTLGQWQEASNLLETQKPTDSVKLAFLDAYIAYKQNNYDKTLKIFDEIEDETQLFKSHIRYFSAIAAYKIESFDKSIEWANKVSPESQFHDHALLLLAKALQKRRNEGDIEESERLLELHRREYPKSPNSAEVQYLLGKVLEQNESLNAAARSYIDCIREHPTSSYANKAEKRFDSLSSDISDKIRKSSEKLKSSPSFLLRKAGRLFSAHQSREVIDLLSKPQKDWPSNKDERCRALYYIGKSYSKLRDHARAGNWYQKLRNACPSSIYRLKALYLGGKGYWNLDRRKKARKWFETIWSEYSDHSYADDAMYFAARSLREEDKFKRAKKLLKKQLERYPTGDMAADAHWMLIRDMIRRDSHTDIIEYVDQISQSFPKDLYNDGRLKYFKARALEQTDRPKKARKLYRRLSMDRPLTYYALLALNRLDGDPSKCTESNLCQDLGDPEELDLELPENIKKEERFKRGVAFIQIGLTGLAGDEFKSLYRAYNQQPEALWGLAKMLDKAQAYHLSHEIPRRQIDRWKSGYPHSAAKNPRWRLAYPKAYRETVNKYASKFDIPSSFVFGLMREESAFQPDIKSWANARGLLQLMDGTARNMAAKLDISYSSHHDLLDIDKNINLGVGYMRQLANDVGVRPPLIAAGYNAGYGNVSNWLEHTETNQLDLWIEDIPYGQTRKYTKRVLSSYWVYAWLYDRKIPNIQLTLPE